MKAYSKSITTNQESDREAYKNLDKLVKRITKGYKENRQRAYLHRLKQTKPNDMGKLYNRLINSNTEPNGQSNGRQLNPKEYIHSLPTQRTVSWCPQVVPFKITAEFQRLVEDAIRAAERKKAVGVEEILVEALQVKPRLASKLVCQIWPCCSELKRLIKPWSTAEIVPIYKRGNPSQPILFRPIALLSHVHKVIEGEIAKGMAGQYSFNDAQLGFHRMEGTDCAISRRIANGQRMKFSALLDLRSACNSVPRNLLMRTIREQLNAELAGMNALTLQPMIQTTRGDRTETVSTCEGAVNQGGPLRPSPFFNLYMDTLVTEPESSETGPRLTCWEERQWDVTAFADDIMLHALCQRKL